MLSASGVRRRRPVILLCALAFFTTLYLAYSSMHSGRRWLPAQAPESEKKQPAKASDAKPQVKDQKPLSPLSYGTTARPPFKDIANFIADLPAHLLPQPYRSAGEGDSSTSSAKRRLIFIGDVHGMKDSLEALLAKLGFDQHRDHAVLLGDMVSKGPDSEGVIRLAMEIGASAVRGNHEDRLLLTHQAMGAKLAPGTSGDDGEIKLPLSARSTTADEPVSDSVADESLFSSLMGTADVKSNTRDTDDEELDSEESGSDSGPDTLEQNPFSHNDRADREIVASLSKKQLHWLKSLPVILRVGTIRESPFRNMVAVHAGIVPGVALESQDPHSVMTMRSLVFPGRDKKKKQKAPGDENVALPVEDRSGEPWAEVFERFQRDKVAVDDDRTTVVFGHDAGRGLKVPHRKVVPGKTFGLDSGCVQGGQLSALVIEATSSGVKHEVVQVDCEDGRKGKGNRRRKGGKNKKKP